MGRNGAIIQQKTVEMTGWEARAGKNISVSWFDGNQTLVVVLK